MQDTWNRLLEALRENVGDANLERWFEPSTFSIDSDRAVLSAPNKFARNWIEENYRKLLEEKLEQISGKRVPLEIAVSEAEQMALPGLAEERPPEKAPKSRKSAAIVKELRLALNQKYTFNNFVVGASNQFAHAAGIAVTDKPGQVYNPLFIYGDVGLGKTHLLNAIGHKILDEHPDYRLRYISAEGFMNEVIYCIRFGKMDDFRKKYRENIDALLVDDIHFLAGNKGATQQEFFFTFNSLFDSSRQIVMSSNQYPKDIPNLDERLVSRLLWGLIVDIQPPDLETKLAILSKKASENNLPLSKELALFLATNLGDNVRELEGSLTRVFAYASLSKVEATLELAREVLKNVLGKQQALTIEVIQKVVASFFNIKVQDLKSQRKMKLVAFPRQICMYLSRKHTNSSFPEIGVKFGGKDHSTVIHAVRKIEERMKEDLTLRNTLETIEKNLCV